MILSHPSRGETLEHDVEQAPIATHCERPIVRSMQIAGGVELDGEGSAIDCFACLEGSNTFNLRHLTSG